MPPRLIEKVLNEFEEKFTVQSNAGTPLLRYTDAHEIRKYLALSLDQAYLAGVEDTWNDMKHEQQKLLDGFGHPEDCRLCARVLEDITKLIKKIHQ